MHDVSCAFLHASVDEDIYLKLPEGLAPEGWVGKLLQAMYGTRRAGLLWSEKIAQCMKKSGFNRSKGCGQLYWHEKMDIVLVVHGDDFLSEGPQASLDWLDAELDKHYTVTRKGRVGPGTKGGEVVEYLHRKIVYREGWGYEYQPDPKHVKLCVEAMGLEGTKGAPTPIILNRKPMPDDQDKLGPAKQKLYMSVTGRVIYYSLDRIDLQFPARLLASAIQSPTEADMRMLKRVVRYMVTTVDYVLYFKFQDDPKWVLGFADSDWAGDKVSRKSCSAAAIMFGSHQLESYSVSQQVIALSSGEAEFYSAGKAIAHLLFILYIMKEIGHVVQIKVLTDSSAARGMMGRIGSGRVRHMQTRFLWVQERLRNREFVLGRVGTLVNPGDVGTKGQTSEALARLLPLAGVGPSLIKRKAIIACIMMDFFGCAEGTTALSKSEMGVTVWQEGVSMVINFRFSVSLVDVCFLLLLAMVLMAVGCIMKDLYRGSSVKKMKLLREAGVTAATQTGMKGSDIEDMIVFRTAVMAGPSGSKRDEGGLTGSETLGRPSAPTRAEVEEVKPIPAQAFQGAVMQQNYGGLTCDKLRDELRSRGLKVSGVKQEIIDRLVADDNKFPGRTGTPLTTVEELATTKAQITFMRMIAGRKGIPIEPRALRLRSEASKWITANQ